MISTRSQSNSVDYEIDMSAAWGLAACMTQMAVGMPDRTRDGQPPSRPPNAVRGDAAAAGEAAQVHLLPRECPRPPLPGGAEDPRTPAGWGAGEPGPPRDLPPIPPAGRRGKPRRARKRQRIAGTKRRGPSPRRRPTPPRGDPSMGWGRRRQNTIFFGQPASPPGALLRRLAGSRPKP